MKRNQHNILSTRNLVMMAILVAIQIILARYLSIQSEMFRISFETIPLALAGIWLGPASGAIVALVSDILGTVLSGIGLYFPPLSLGPVTFAVLCGLGAKYLRKYQGVWEYILMPVTVTLAGIINSFVVGVAAFVWYQISVMGTEGSFWGLAAIDFGSRLATKPLTIIATTLAVFLIDRAAYRPVVSRILSRHGA